MADSLTILSRSSTLAVAQARQVAAAITARWPNVGTRLISRPAAGDLDRQMALAAAEHKGLFTADLSDALARGDADIVVHSWKDLPIASRPDTVVAATLARADVRDVLLVRRDAVDARPSSFHVLTSSPRRAWQLNTSLASLLPWPTEEIRTEAVRGNVPTRLEKLVRGDAHALVVAKAALDRLLGPTSPEDTVADVRRVLDRCRWMVLPLRQFPSAPAQGALAIEVATRNAELIERLQLLTDAVTERACRREREILASYGGGCHEAIGATVLERHYGTITSVRGHRQGETLSRWSLDHATPIPQRPARPDDLWPGPSERFGGTRVSRPTQVVLTNGGLWITRAEALPPGTAINDDSVVWTAGPRTWEKLANRGVWVHGSADGLGDEEKPDVDDLAGRPIDWQWLTHGDSGRPGATPTYDVRYEFPDDLDERTHFYWTSASAFRAAFARFPGIRHGWHASGPGRTARVIRTALGASDRASIWLDYDSWLTTLLR